MSNTNAKFFKTLNNGRTMPLLGIGTWLSKPGEIEHSIRIALENGYRHIDSAAIYRNEKEIGQVLTALIHEEKKVKREELFVTSKLWNTFHAKEHVRNACLQTLQNLNLDYLDMYLIHWPLAFAYAGDDLHKEGVPLPRDEQGMIRMQPVSLRETWEEMEKLVQEGLVKSIGVSNFDLGLIYEILSFAKIKPACNQVECHPFLAQNHLLKGLKDIALVAYSPLGHMHEGSPVHHSKIIEIAEKHLKTPAQILLRWNIQRGCVVIPKSIREQRIIENGQVFDFELDNDEMEAINALQNEKTMRTCDPFHLFGVPLFGN
ncbi:hypothetical protein C9374_003590 [Naegleria lovaniensis]|uniref:NADP-dependent oxidoreductase domain-containing protein n=1 Tax=Naegleria lovaniensis TaxID=51637 RepID=A0AA88H516_NAELO|nr:uncharacterized protein C9374_003590 [Naegleria lovaniensis]KAG2393826.1 hypothetical protein C9374_003590 [Naegleria lovaniensis]